VSKFAQARYRATGFRSLGGDKYAADGTLELRGVSKPVTLTFTWTPGAAPVLAGKATVKRLDFGVGGGDWSDTATIPDEVAVSTKVVFKPVQERRQGLGGKAAEPGRAGCDSERARADRMHASPQPGHPP
jgi:hypothetical protein